MPDIAGMECDIANLDLQRGIALNLSKCALKRGLKGWAVRWALIATALIKGNISNHVLIKMTVMVIIMVIF
jgi:hypothetical protein